MFQDLRFIRQFQFFFIFKVLFRVSIEKIIMNGPVGLFCKMNILLVMLAYVPWHTLISNVCICAMAYFK